MIITHLLPLSQMCVFVIFQLIGIDLSQVGTCAKNIWDLHICGLRQSRYLHNEMNYSSKFNIFDKLLIWHHNNSPYATFTDVCICNFSTYLYWSWWSRCMCKKYLRPTHLWLAPIHTSTFYDLQNNQADKFLWWFRSFVNKMNTPHLRWWK